jgi:hypothetical protein
MIQFKDIAKVFRINAQYITGSDEGLTGAVRLPTSILLTPAADPFSMTALINRAPVFYKTTLKKRKEQEKPYSWLT